MNRHRNKSAIVLRVADLYWPIVIALWIPALHAMARTATHLCSSVMSGSLVVARSQPVSLQVDSVQRQEMFRGRQKLPDFDARGIEARIVLGSPKPHHLTLFGHGTNFRAR